MSVKKLRKSKVYYLASPYSHSSAFIQQLRYEAVLAAAARLTNMGYTFLEPIGMSHDQSTKYELPGGYKFWQRRDRGFIARTDAVAVLTLPGWEESEGVTDELQYAKRLGREVIHLDPREIFTEYELNCLSPAVNIKTDVISDKAEIR